MKPYFQHLIILSLFSVVFSITAQASLALFGSTAYQVIEDQKQVTISIDRLQSREQGGLSSRIRVQLWATPNQHLGGDVQGSVFGSFELQRKMIGVENFDDLVRTVAYQRPANGVYFVVLTVEEYVGGRFLIREFRTFTNRLTVSDAATIITTPQGEVAAFQSAFPGVAILGNGFWEDPALGIIYSPSGNWFHIRRYNRWYFFTSTGTWDRGLWVWDQRYASWAYSRRDWYPAIFYARFNEWRLTGFR